MTDAQLDTYRKIPYNFQLKLSSHLGGVVVRRFCDKQPDGRTGGVYGLAPLAKILYDNVSVIL